MANRIVLNGISYFGKGCIEEIATEAKSRNFNHISVVTDKVLVETGTVKKVEDVLKSANIEYAIYDDVVPNPTIENIQHGVDFINSKKSDAIIAFGGGSPIDTAKGIGIIVANPEFYDVKSLEGLSPTKNPSLPILAVPTTSGTAAEVTINYVVTDSENKRKFVCVDPHDVPVVAFIDSDLMMGMPPKLAASTGMDALTHAIEGYTTLAAWEMTDVLHINAIKIIANSLADSVNKKDEKAREQMALGQYMAGMGFSNVGLGLVHGMAHPLSAQFGLPHGVACAIMLPVVMKYNLEFTGEKYRDIANAFGIKNAYTGSLDDVRLATVEAVANLGKTVGIPKNLKKFGITAEAIAPLSNDALKDICTPGNPRPVKLEDIKELYSSLI